MKKESDKEQEEKLVYKEVFNPKAQQKLEWSIQPLVERPSTLTGKTLYLINTRWHGAEEQEPLLFAIKARMEAMIPGINIVYKLKRGPYTYNDPDLWNEIAAKGDEAIIGVGH